EFVVVPGEKALLQEPDVLTLTLTAPESYGVDAGSAAHSSRRAGRPGYRALLTGKTFELVPGDGEPRKEFVVVPGEKALLQEPDVLTLTLTAPESYGVDAG
ncbi:hypothetical protein, partial [Enterobacter hormaechei]|uniref:hypothetical protein n=1 Tax=Enterobacter hormaechei TaxID=158836 RepID=UPI0013FE2010